MRFLEDKGVLYEKQGPVMGRYEGCWFRLDLPESVAPASGTRSISRWEHPPDEIPDCSNINWIRLDERDKPTQDI